MSDCVKLGCERSASFRLGMLLRAPMDYEPCPPIEAWTGLLVCEDHNAPPVSDLVTDEGWSRMVAAIVAQGRVAPDRHRTEIIAVALGDQPDVVRGWES